MKGPYITLKFAATLDGKIAASDGSSRWISGPKSRKFVHRLRAGHDAVLVGIGTVLADNPLLTTHGIKGKNPARIVIDGELRTPFNSKIVKTARNIRTIIVTTPKSTRLKTEKMRKKGVEVIVFPSKNSRIDLKKVMRELRREGIKNILVEGGKGTLTAFIKAGLFDRVIAVISPKILGKGLEAVGDLGIKTIKGAIKLRPKSVKRLGDDVIIETVR